MNNYYLFFTIKLLQFYKNSGGFLKCHVLPSSDETIPPNINIAVCNPSKFAGSCPNGVSSTPAFLFIITTYGFDPLFLVV